MKGRRRDSNLQFVRDMLTKKAFDREAVLRTYCNIRRGGRGAGQGAGSGHLVAEAVGRRPPAATGALRVRNAIYEQVFDERWARDHLRLNVNWRRRLHARSLPSCWS